MFHVEHIYLYMSFEIEHKYLVKRESWEKIVPNKSATISQGYMLNADAKLFVFEH